MAVGSKEGSKEKATDAETTYRRVWRLLLALGLVSVVGALLVLFLDRAAIDPLFQQRFDVQTWAGSGLEKRDRERLRWRMVDDLVEHHLRLGMTTAQAEALLGPRDPDPMLSLPEEGDWLYMIGPTPSELLGVLWDMLTPGSGDADGMWDIDADFRALLLRFDSTGALEHFEVLVR